LLAIAIEERKQERKGARAMRARMRVIQREREREISSRTTAYDSRGKSITSEEFNKA
jgi:hypothetical protein